MVVGAWKWASTNWLPCPAPDTCTPVWRSSPRPPSSSGGSRLRFPQDLILDCGLFLSNFSITHKPGCGVPLSKSSSSFCLLAIIYGDYSGTFWFSEVGFFSLIHLKQLFFSSPLMKEVCGLIREICSHCLPTGVQEERPRVSEDCLQ